VTATIEVGQPAPDFTLPASEGRRVRLRELLEAGNTVVLAFYPLDFSPKCSSELTQFQATYEHLRAMGAEVIGVSTDSSWCHTAFAKRLGLEFPLVSDFNREIIGDYVGFYESIDGMRNVSRRGIVVVDPSGIVRWTWSTDDPGQVPDTEAVREAVQEIAHEGR
jgi:peroxiredoxin